MPEYYFRELLGRFDSAGRFSCACGREHGIGTKEVVIGPRALEESRDVLERMYGPRSAIWVLSDGNTEKAAGERWKSGLRASRVVSRVLPAEPKPVPTLELVRKLAAEVRSAGPDLIVSVGSGVLSDLGKHVSLETGIPNWCIATAASVDAYSSATAAIRVGGYHEALPTRVSELIVCDLEVISRAPSALFLSGLGDLLAKFIANLDWNLSRLMTGEHYCPVLADFALGSARKALEAARGSARNPLEAVSTLTDAVLVSGFAMQALGGSRPAASAEHTIAHYWEMAGAVGNEDRDLHGILVGAASTVVLEAYARYYGRLAGFTPDAAARMAALAGEPAWDKRLEKGLVGFRDKIAAEMKGRSYSGEIMAGRIGAFLRSRAAITDMARPLLDELARAVETLSAMGFPFSLDALEIQPDARGVAFRNVRLLRNRYTTFDLAYELGNAAEMGTGPM